MAELSIDLTPSKIAGFAFSVLSIIGLLIGYAFAADSKYVDIDELSDIIRHSDIQRIEARIEDYEDKIFVITDKELDGTATPGDVKSKKRYEYRLRKYENELDAVRKSN